MTITKQLFPELKKIRKTRTVMAKVEDVGIDEAIFTCQCGWSSGWIDVTDWNITKCKKGVPCKMCNSENK